MPGDLAIRDRMVVATTQPEGSVGPVITTTIVGREAWWNESDLRPMFRDYLAIVISKKSKSTLRMDQESIPPALDFFKVNHKGVLSPDAVQDFVNRRIRVGKSYGIDYIRYSRIITFTKWCIKTGRLDQSKNPFQSVTIPKRPQRPPPDGSKIITPAQYRAIMSMATKRTVGWIVMLAWNTGMSLIDCCRLKWRDVRFEEAVICRARQKTGVWATIPYPRGGELERGLIEKREAAKLVGLFNPDDPVSPHHATDGVSGSMQTTLRQIRIDLGLPDTITFHAFRYTFASMMMSSGMSPINAAKVTGHLKLSQLAHYTIPNNESIRLELEGAKKEAGRDLEIIASHQEPEPIVGPYPTRMGFQPSARYTIKFDRQPRLPDGRRIQFVQAGPDAAGLTIQATPIDINGTPVMNDTIEVHFRDVKRLR